MRVLFFIVLTLAGENALAMKVLLLEQRVLIEAGVSFVAAVGKLPVFLGQIIILCDKRGLHFLDHVTLFLIG